MEMPTEGERHAGPAASAGVVRKPHAVGAPLPQKTGVLASGKSWIASLPPVALALQNMNAGLLNDEVAAQFGHVAAVGWMVVPHPFECGRRHGGCLHR